jgi:hypothetical protein
MKIKSYELILDGVSPEKTHATKAGETITVVDVYLRIPAFVVPGRDGKPYNVPAEGYSAQVINRKIDPVLLSKLTGSLCVCDLKLRSFNYVGKDKKHAYGMSLMLTNIRLK